MMNNDPLNNLPFILALAKGHNNREREKLQLELESDASEYEYGNEADLCNRLYDSLDDFD